MPRLHWCDANRQKNFSHIPEKYNNACQKKSFVWKFDLTLHVSDYNTVDINQFNATIVLIVDGNSGHVAHARRTTCFFNHLKFKTAVSLNKCLRQIKLPISLNTCAYFSDLLTNIGTMSVQCNGVNHQCHIDLYQCTMVWLIRQGQ